MSVEKPGPAFSPEDLKRRRRRSLVMALCLVGFAVLFYVTTIVRIGGHILDRAQ
jgi:hypothetical protein